MCLVEEVEKVKEVERGSDSKVRPSLNFSGNYFLCKKTAWNYHQPYNNGLLRE